MKDLHELAGGIARDQFLDHGRQWRGEVAQPQLKGVAEMISAERGLLHAWTEHVPILKEAFPLLLCPGLLPITDIVERTTFAHPGRQLFAGSCQQIGILSLQSYKDEPPSRACSQFRE